MKKTNSKRKEYLKQLQDEIINPLVENGRILQQHILVNGGVNNEKEKKEIQKLNDDQLANLAFFSAVIKLQRQEFYSVEEKIKIDNKSKITKLKGDEFYETQALKCVMAALGLQSAAFAYAKNLISLGKFTPASASVFTMADDIALTKALGKRAFLAVGLAWAIYEFTDCMIGE